MAENYKIISQWQSHEVTATGGLVDIMHIDFVTLPSGFAAYVRLPLAQYPAGVDAALATMAARMEAVAQA